MEACEAVRLFVNKAIVPAEPKRRATPGFGRVKALIVLVYASLKKLILHTLNIIEKPNSFLFS